MWTSSQYLIVFVFCDTYGSQHIAIMCDVTVQLITEKLEWSISEKTTTPFTEH